ncbi:uncharacterized protein [Littorina saxatilis]|uniref:Uncharacterized protein n=1 Tax=Littorina saxatilis TaxID=31220 RepID=A0AAN9G345_9CAEN
MSFEVNFGSQSNAPDRGGGSRGGRHRGGQRAEQHKDQSGKTEPGDRDQSRGRGRGRGGRRRAGRGYRGRGRGGNRAAGEGNKEDEEGEYDEDDGGDSDGGSSVTSEGQGRGGRRGGDRGRGHGGRDHGGRGRGGNQGYEQRGGKEATHHTEGQPKEVHIHHYYSHGPNETPPPPPQGGTYPPPSGNYHQPYPGPPPPPPSYPSYPQQPPTSYPSQPGYQPAYPPTYGQPFPAHATFSQAGPLPGSRPPLLNQPPLYTSPSQTPYRQPQPEQNYNTGYQKHQQQSRSEPGQSAGSERGSRQNLNQRPAAEKGGEGKQKQQDQHTKKGPKSKRNESEQRENTGNQDKARKAGQKQEDGEAAKPSNIPELGPDEWIKIFNLLLRQFQGRTKLGTLLSQKGNLFKGFSHEDAAEWLKHSNRFLTFEKNGVVKYVSVSYKEARSCFKYKKHNTDRCVNETCPWFHICRDFIAGCCPWDSSCHFNHSFHTKSNAKVCVEAGLQAFTDEEIRIISFRSSPVVCMKFGKGACQELDCPDIHICPQFLRDECNDEACNFGHLVKGPEHNNWVLTTYHMQGIPEQTLRKMVIAPDTDLSALDAQAKQVPPDPAEKFKKPAPGMKKAQSKDRLLDNSETPATKGQNLQKGRSQEALFQKLEMLLPTTFPVQEKRVRRRGKQQSGRDQDENGRDEEQNWHGKEQMVRSLSPQQSPPKPSQRPRPLSPNRAASKEGGDNQRPWPASHYTHLCEQFSWTGKCSRNYLCPRYHHRDKPPHVWQVHVSMEWQDFSTTDNFDIEQHFCALASHEVFEAVLDNIGGVKLSLDFNAMTAKVLNNYGADSAMSPGLLLKLRRWSTPSYVETEGNTPLNYYTQWCWYQMGDQGKMQPFIPGTLQYTLEEKSNRGQQKYFFEAGEERFLLLLQEMVLINLTQGSSSNVMRRPVSSFPDMSTFLLSEPPHCRHANLPTHWSSIDHYQDFEMVELDSSGTEYLDVARSFHTTVTRESDTILRVFRVQNPGLWDKYCSTRRSMTPRDGNVQDVAEKKLYHGTPTLQAARGICANNIDFRRSGEYAGSRYGRGAYFSTHAMYSKNFTRGPDRYMFLAKVLVGKYTRGEQSYTSPPVREGLKLYDSCVDDESAPTIFVIFDLAQSYPEYLIQFEDARIESPLGQQQSPGVGPAAVLGSGSGFSGQDPLGSSRSGITPGSAAQKPVPAPRPSARPLPRGVQYTTQDAGLQYSNPYAHSATGVAGAVPKSQARASPDKTKSSSAKKSDNDKCLIS